MITSSSLPISQGAAFSRLQFDSDTIILFICPNMIGTVKDQGSGGDDGVAGLLGQDKYANDHELRWQVDRLATLYT